MKVTYLEFYSCNIEEIIIVKNVYKQSININFIYKILTYLIEIIKNNIGKVLKLNY